MNSSLLHLKEKTHKPVQRKNDNSIFFFQAKHKINEPNDLYEQEADAMADKVMRMKDNTNGKMFFKPADISNVQRMCTDCEEEEENLQRKENSNVEVEADNELDRYVGNINSGGNALPYHVRSFFEPRLGYDFSNVKIHKDSLAARSAQSINALAYTTGNNIVFNENQYSPETDSGKKLLAHELTHVVQQGSSDLIRRQVTSTKDCTAAKEKEIIAALPIARSMVSHAINVLGRPLSQDIQNLLDLYFNDYSVSTSKHALNGFNNIDKGINSSFRIECEEPGNFMYSFFCDGYHGYTRLFGLDNVHLCDTAFGRSSIELAETIVHECSHKFDWTGDKAYCWNGCPSTLDRWRAYNNADSYSKFARDAYFKIP